MAHLRPRRVGLLVGSAGVFALGTAAVLSASCGGNAGVLVSQVIGPEGGELTAKGISIDIPAGALGTETEITVRKSNADLSVRDFEQVGAALVIEPEDLELLLPVTVTLEGEEGAATLLIREPGETVVWDGDTAHTAHFGELARAAQGTVPFDFDEPNLGSSPTSAGSGHTDTVHVEAATDSRTMDLRLTAWDYDKAYGPLNGDGHCAFAVRNIEGGSITTGCSGGELTASLAVTEDWVRFDLEPFLAPNLPDDVPVTVIASDGEVGFAAGFLSFGTSACYLQECGGHGTCMLDGSSANCMCDDGYALMEDPTVCECVPQCSGVECGSDGCGGQCAPGCGGDEMCDNGMCIPTDPTTTSGDGDGSTGDGDGDGMTGDGDGTTGDGDGDGDGTSTT
jgi:hypothetical protein